MTLVRTPIIAANWKMNGSLDSCRVWMSAWTQLGRPSSCRTVLCAPNIYLSTLAALARGTGIALGGEDVSEFSGGAYTGETSASMLLDVGAEWVIVGHSERRQLFGDTNERVAKKALAAAEAGLKTIVCVGEPLEAREAGRTENVILSQLDAVLQTVAPASLGAIAYEPVWAIGTGRTASPETAQAVHEVIRARVAESDPAAAAALPILYGGSVKPSNAAGLFAMPDIDGALVGGAALQAEDFHAIAQACPNR